MFVLIFFILLCFVHSDDSGFYTSFKRDDDDLYVYKVLTESDQAYYLIGQIWSDYSHGGSYNYDAFIIKVSATGKSMIWRKMYGSTGVTTHDYVRDATFASDGNILFVGESNNMPYVTKVDKSTGSIIFSNIMNVPTTYDAYGVTSDPSTGRIIVVATGYYSYIYAQYGYIYCFTSGGTLLYEKIIGRDGYPGSYRYEYPYSTRHASNGFTIGGKSNAPSGGARYDFVVSKWTYSPDVSMVYSHYLGLTGINYYVQAIEDSNTVDVVVGGSVGDCVVLIKLTPNPATILFTKKYCPPSGYMYGKDLMEFDDYYVMTGRLYYKSQSNAFVLRFDKTTGDLILAEYTRDVYSYDTITKGTNGDAYITVAGRLYNDNYDNTLRLVQFRNDGSGCHIFDITDLITTADNPLEYYGNYDPLPEECSFTASSFDFTYTYMPSLTMRSPICCNNVEEDNEFACSGHGECFDWNNCSCNPLYPGEWCEKWSCFGVPVDDVDTYCGNNETENIHAGICVDWDLCFCIPGYSSKKPRRECTEWMCEKLDKDDPNACTGRGRCVSSQTCDCRDDYEGIYCDTWSCGADYRLKEVTCSGHGECYLPNTCKCDSGFSGDLCETNMMYYTVMAPILSTFGLTTFLVVLTLLLCVCCAICCCICCMYLGVVGVTCLAGVVMLQKKTMKKFGKLKNIDILIKEQELESDETVAHLTISKSLFEIPYDEIHLESIIGEGGSSSVVYRAKWRKQTVAFKCFKTRQVCSDQNSFDEFEAEVKVMSSISHPNIIRFFGGSLQPPRVGIVMEFCDNGDLCIFLKKYERDNDHEIYPLEEKVRMMHEVAAALEYLHSRNILHRDLKLENVLVDMNENCKLMDFGLSKIVERVSRAQTKSIGTNIYMSPEIVNSGIYDEKTDVFSFGIMMFILITQNWEPYGQDERVVELRVAQDPTFRPDVGELDRVVTKKGDEWMKKLMVCLWDHEPRVRKSFTEVLEIIEERTVVEEAMNDFDEEEDSKDDVTIRSDSRRARAGGKNMDSSQLQTQYDILYNENRKTVSENNRLKKKDRVMRRQLFVVQKEKERLVRVLTKSGVDFQQNHAPAAPSRESQLGIKPSIMNEIEVAKRNSKNKVMYKKAPLPPSQQNQQQQQPKKQNLLKQHLKPSGGRVNSIPPGIPPKRNVFYQKNQQPPPSIPQRSNSFSSGGGSKRPPPIPSYRNNGGGGGGGGDNPPMMGGRRNAPPPKIPQKRVNQYY